MLARQRLGVRFIHSGKVFTNEFGYLKPEYAATKYPIVLCHGLFGWDTIRSPLPVIVKDLSYWHGIKEALQQHNATVVSAGVSPIGAIDARARELQRAIEEQVEPNTTVNIIGHSMGGLDARYLVSVLKPSHFRVASVTTVATPHRGSPVADMLLRRLSKRVRRRVVDILSLMGIDDAAGIDQLATKYMEQFNREVPDAEGVSYLSYGARFHPTWTSLLKYPGRYIKKTEGDNDGMVSVQSAQWGEYMGTLDNCDHLDVINLTGFSAWMQRLANRPASFNAIALYLYIMDSLAKRGF